MSLSRIRSSEISRCEIWNCARCEAPQCNFDFTSEIEAKDLILSSLPTQHIITIIIFLFLGGSIVDDVVDGVDRAATSIFKTFVAFYHILLIVNSLKMFQ